MTNIEKYKNWLTIIDSDYISLFIKSWFTFLATLQDIFPEIKNEKELRENYKVLPNSVSLWLFDKTFNDIDSIVNKAKDFIKNNNSWAYYKLYFTYNRWPRTYETWPSNSKLILRLSCENKKIKVAFKNDTKSFLKFYSWDIHFEISITDIIKNKLNDEQLLEHILKKVDKISSNKIDNSKLNSRSKTNKKSEISTFIQELRINLEIQNDIFTKIDVCTLDKTKKIIIFIDLVYLLRNILFHWIINPFDKEIQNIYKIWYYILIDLIEANILYLENNLTNNAN